MSIASSFQSLCWIGAAYILMPQASIVAQGRPLSIFAGAGFSGAVGTMAEGSETALTLGLGVERRVLRSITLGVDVVGSSKGGKLNTSEFLASNSRVSLTTLGLAPVARYYFGGESARPVISAGVLVWKVTGCSVDYDSEIGGFLGSDDLTESCADFMPDDSAPAPLDGLDGSSGTSLLLGFGWSGRKFGFEVRAELPLGQSTRATEGHFGFGNTLSLVGRYYPKV